MRCGHVIHWSCYEQLCQQDFRCPLCKKSVADMSPVWQQMAHEMAAQPMPPEAARRVRILCHDCTEHSQVGRHHRTNTHSRARARALRCMSFDDARVVAAWRRRTSITSACDARRLDA